MPGTKKQQACMECTKKCLKAHGKKPSSSSHDPSAPLSFFKIMIGDFKEIVFIPPKVSQAFRGLVNSNNYLEDSNGRRWRVKISTVDGSLAFYQGWRDFVEDHNIEIGEFIIFTQMNKSVFSVKVYGTSACERLHFCNKSSANKREQEKSPIKNSEAPTEKNHKMDMDEEITTVDDSIVDRLEAQHNVDPISSVLDKDPKSKEEVQLSDALDPGVICDRLNGGGVAGKFVYGRQSTNKKHNAGKTVNRIESYSVVCEPEMSYETKENLVDKHTRINSSPCETVVEVPSARTLDCSENVKELLDSSSEAELIRMKDASCVQGDGQQPVRMIEISQFHEGGSCKTDFVEPEDEKVNSCFNGEALGVVKREDEDSIGVPSPDRANLSFSVIVNSMLWLNLHERLPIIWGRKKLKRKMVMLRDQSTRLWPMIYHENFGFVGFIAGWEAFAIANNLKKGDMCELELANEPETMFRVHRISRN